MNEQEWENEGGAVTEACDACGELGATYPLPVGWGTPGAKVCDDAQACVERMMRARMPDLPTRLP